MPPQKRKMWGHGFLLAVQAALLAKQGAYDELGDLAMKHRWFVDDMIDEVALVAEDPETTVSERTKLDAGLGLLLQLLPFSDVQESCAGEETPVWLAAELPHLLIWRDVVCGMLSEEVEEDDRPLCEHVSAATVFEEVGKLARSSPYAAPLHDRLLELLYATPTEELPETCRAAELGEPFSDDDLVDPPRRRRPAFGSLVELLTLSLEAE